MSNEAPLPALPVYEKPKDRVPATIPQGMEVTKMPSSMNKLLSRGLSKSAPRKVGKLKSRLGTGRAGKAHGISITSSVKIGSKLSKNGKETK